MARAEIQKLYDDLAKLTTFIQNYLSHITKDMNLDGAPFEERLKRFLVPYSDLQIAEYMKDSTDESPKAIPIIAQALTALLSNPDAAFEPEFYSELKIIHELLHTPGKLIPSLHSDNIILKDFNFKTHLNALTKINILLHLCQDFATIEAYRQMNAATVDVDFPLLKILTLEWLTAQFNAIKIIAANPHKHIGIAGDGPIPTEPFPIVGGDEVALLRQVVQPAAPNPAPVIPHAPLPILAPISRQGVVPPVRQGIAQPIAHPVPIVRPVRQGGVDVLAPRVFVPNARLGRDNNPPPVYQPYVPRAGRFDARVGQGYYNPPRPPNGTFWGGWAMLLAGIYLGYHYHGVITSGLYSLASMIFSTSFALAKSGGVLLYSSINTAVSGSFALAQSAAPAIVAFLATASWPVLIALSLLSLYMVSKGVSILANRSHAQGHANMPIRPDFEERLRNHLGQRAPRDQNDIGQARAMRFSPNRAALRDEDLENPPNRRNRNGIRI